jgi:hypothetical protein
MDRDLTVECGNVHNGATPLRSYIELLGRSGQIVRCRLERHRRIAGLSPSLAVAVGIALAVLYAIGLFVALRG